MHFLYTCFPSIDCEFVQECLLSTVHLVLHTHGIVPTFLKFYSWSPGAGFIPITSTKGINQIKKEKLQEKKLSFMHTKRFNTFNSDCFDGNLCLSM